MAEERRITQTRMAGPIRPRPPASAVLTPKEVLGILRRHMLLIIILTVLGLAAGGAACTLLRKFLPKFTARTFIEVLPPVQTDPMTIVTPLVQKDIRYGYRLSMVSLLKQQNTLEALLERDSIRRTKWYDGLGDTRSRVKSLKKHMNATAHRDADFVEVSMTCRDPQEAADIVNETVALFVGTQGGTKRQEINARLVEVQQQRDSVAEDVRQAEVSLQELRDTTQITDLEGTVGRYFKHTITLKLDQLEIEKNGLEMAIKQLEADIENARELATGPITVQIEHAVENDPIMVTLAQQLALSEARLASILTKFGENHREVRQLQEMKDEIKARRDVRAAEIAEQTRQANLENAMDRLIVFKERYVELERLRQEAAAKKADLDRARVAYEQRVKIRDERIEVLDEIKKQIEKLRIMHDDPEAPKVRSLGQAPKPLEMVMSRQWWLWFPAGTVLSFLLGVGLAFLIELANDLVRTPRDVGKYIGIPLLGVVPDASEDRQVRGVDLRRVVSQAPYSLLSESYRQCRTNLKLSGSGASLKSLLVTSGSAGDGKTCVAVNLATAFVAEDKKVLLIDANFRQPALERLFPKGGVGGVDEGGLDVGFGLSSLLVGQCSAQEAIRSSGVDGLDIIDAGMMPPNPTELLGSGRMAQLLKEQSNNYDYVIVDSPPVLLMSDAKVLAGLVDATVLVFNAAATHRGAAVRMVQGLQDVDANVVGCVLLGAPSLKGGYFQEQFRSYRKYQQKMELAGA